MSARACAKCGTTRDGDRVRGRCRSCYSRAMRRGELVRVRPRVEHRAAEVLEELAGFNEGMREAVTNIAWRQRLRPRPGVAQVGLEDLLLELADAWRLGLTVEDLRR